MLVIELEAGNLICAINSNTKVAICSAVDPDAIFTQKKTVILQNTDL